MYNYIRGSIVLIFNSSLLLSGTSAGYSQYMYARVARYGDLCLQFEVCI